MQIKVVDMMCSHCVNEITKLLENLGGKNIKIDLSTKIVYFENVDIKVAISEIEDIGFTVEE